MISASISIEPQQLQHEFRAELIAIADWWVTHTIDKANGGFYGEVDANNVAVASANKGIILNSRILWFFSEVSLVVDKEDYKYAARRAYDYLVDYFIDKDYGGVYWELDAKGTPVNTKKQVYAQAFTIYALSAYYQLTRDEAALTHALKCFDMLERKTIDRKNGGYLEAFSRTWGPLDDLRLSAKDLNFPKSQNTHLHVLEAYTSLNKIHPTPKIRAALRYTIEMFDLHMIDRNTHHLRMFMDIEWRDFSTGYTYGHDIEASWLIAKALESLDDECYTKSLMPTLIKITEVTLQEGVGKYGQVVDAYDFTSRTQLPDIVWWVQAEALVGFAFAYHQTREKKYLNAAIAIWEFIKKYQVDNKGGEWFWLSTLDQPQADPYYKVGFWKCPYHNGRAMIEAARYLESYC